MGQTNATAQSGFTLIELLTAMAIVGILSAVATAQFRAYEKRAFDARAQTDLRKLLVAEEAYFTESEHYVACAGPACELQFTGVELSPNTEVNITTENNDLVFVAEAYHPQGERRFTFRSDRGRIRATPLP